MGVLKNDVGRPSNKTIMIRTILKSIAVVIVGTGLVAGGYYLNDYQNKSNKNSIEKGNQNIKVDNKKDYVYDATYDYDKTNYEIATHDRFNEDNETNSEFNILKIDRSKSKNYFDDLNVPYININTTDAKKVNAEIKNLFSEYVNKVEKDVIPALNGETDDLFPVLHIDYKTYVDDNYLSIVIEHGEDGTSAPSYNFIGYVFNLKDGSLVKLSDYDKDNNLKSKLCTEVSKYIKEENRVNNKKYGSDISDESKSLKYIDDAWENSNKIVSIFENNSDNFKPGIIYYIDNGKVNFITYIYTVNSELEAVPKIFEIKQ